MVKAIGVDIVKVLRIAKILQSSRKDRFLRRVLHEEERLLLGQLPSFKKLLEYIAGSWAAKEAVFKTLDTVDQKQFQFKDWCRYKKDGKPYIRRDPPDMRSEFLLLISHDEDHLIAMVLRIERGQKL